ncbi:hypothetical protein Fmac_014162 [Flemingia macrophylla]|uniref:Uncharacterized protein n=1 Tax=Flemingia macrophylla TaxID=520843 RepID=A0ABD1MAX6_9FABA
MILMVLMTGDMKLENPVFSAIERSAGFLDRELAASGFTRKDEEDTQRVLNGLQIYVQFIEVVAESDINSDSEGVDTVEDPNEAANEADAVDGDSSHLLEQDCYYVLTRTRDIKVRGKRWSVNCVKALDMKRKMQVTIFREDSECLGKITILSYMVERGFDLPRVQAYPLEDFAYPTII